MRFKNNSKLDYTSVSWLDYLWLAIMAVGFLTVIVIKGVQVVL